MTAFNPTELEKYRSEAQEKWGETAAYREYTQRHYSGQEQNALAGEMDHIMAAFALCMKQGNTPDSSQAQTLVKSLQNFITGNYYLCTKQILAGLGQMYVADPRFTANIDQHADGTAKFIRDAIGVHCSA